MTRTLSESFFSLGKMGTQCLVLLISSGVSALKAPLAKYSPIVVVIKSAPGVFLGGSGCGTLCRGILTPFLIPWRSTLSAPSCSQFAICALGPRNGHNGVRMLFVSSDWAKPCPMPLLGLGVLFCLPNVLPRLLLGPVGVWAPSGAPLALALAPSSLGVGGLGDVCLLWLAGLTPK